MAAERRDPLEDDPPHECDGGWISVKPPYARHLALGKVNGDENDARFPVLYAALLNSVYPCRICRPVQFYRWAGKHYMPDHDVSACADCIEAHGGRGASRKAQMATARAAGSAVTEQVRRDLE